MEPQEQASSSSYPVTLEARPPVRFDRIQVLVRLLVLAAIGVLHQTAGGLLGTLYVLVPILVAILVSQRGGRGFLEIDGRRIIAALEWVIAFYGFLLFVSDRLPLPPGDGGVHVAVRPRGAPTMTSALSRLVASLPHAVVLAVLGMASCLVALVAAMAILITEGYPDALHAFQRDVLAWMARLFAYHASLVDTYPPFSLGASGAKPTGYAPPV